MASYSAIISYIPLRSSLANVPRSVSSVLFNSNIAAQHVVLELVYTKKSISKSVETKAFVGWTGMTSAAGPSSNSALEIDPTFAQTLGLQPHQQVTIKLHVNPVQANVIHLEPVTSGDWEIVETHAQFLESWMINQVRAVSLLHGITVYPSPSAIASLKVTKFEPEPTGQFAMISPDSEIIVAPKVKKQPKQQTDNANGTKSMTSHRKKHEKDSSSCILVRGITLPHESFSSLLDVNSLALQVHGDPELLLYPLRGAEYVNVTIIQPSSLQPNQGPVPKATNQETFSGSPSGPCTSVVAQFVHNSSVPDGHAVLSYGLSAALGVTGSLGNVVKLEPATKALSRQPNSIIIHPYAISSQPNPLKLGDNAEKQQQEVQRLDKIKDSLLSRGFLNGPIANRVQIPPLGEILPYGGIIELESSGWVRSGADITLSQGTEVILPESAIPPTARSLIDRPKQRQVVGIDKQFKQYQEAIRSGSSGTLLYGGRGAGKSVVLRDLKAGLEKDLIHTIFFSCGLHGEKKIQSVRETMKKLFLEAAWYAPSVVIFDDIDKLIPAEVEHVNSTNTSQLAEIFRQTAFSIMARRPVSILATSQSKESLHSSLVTSHLFQETFRLRSPNKDVREAILSEAVVSLGRNDQNAFDLLEVVGTTEGYNPGDLWTLVERAHHQSILRSLSGENTNSGILQEDFDRAMEDFTPSSLRGVKLQNSSVSWNDIGGLREAKSIILETLEWPTKYAPIFANCPLRLRSGLLLYGYPGCGKTLLASAVAAHCGLNFISIKGPEILNKYIGASEQSVRELFERAQAAKPCILFFDEFDSIAPKRGHDSTGVTDRVVNQMLTQMDGAEGLDGVYVLAATSRPDLIDSALLRPGRLDKSILCDMPNFEDRLSILQAIQGKMNMRNDVSLSEVASQTDGYSGADLQALLYNAYLDAIHDVVDNKLDGDTSVDSNQNHEFFQLRTALGECKSIRLSELPVADRTSIVKKLDVLFGGSDNKPESTRQDEATASVTITPEHIHRSLQDTKPSISVKERRKLQAVYNQFVSGRSGEMPSGTASQDIGGRVTLM